MALDPGTAIVGFVGLGVMGRSIALSLVRGGARMLVHTRTRERAQPVLAAGAEWRDTPADVAAGCDVAFTMLGLPEEVADVYVGPDGLLESARPGSYLVDLTTSKPELARRIWQAASARGVHALDAPVSGGGFGAREGHLPIMVGGESADFEVVRPLLERLGTPVLQGAAGAGQQARLCSQIAIAGGIIGVCEALAYARRAGLDTGRVLGSLVQGTAGSWLLSHLGPRILHGDYEPGVRVKHFVKDVGIALEAAEEMDIDLPGVELARMLFQEVAEMGFGDAGTQALFAIWDEEDDDGDDAPELVQLR